MNKKMWMVMLWVLLAAAYAFAVDYPQLTSWVNDYARVLSSNQKDELGQMLKDFETQTTNQIFVCILPNLPAGTQLEDYVNELFARWQPGQKGKDNGALLAIFINDRKMRIESGYGLEPTLTDAASKLIIANEMTPSFKQGDYYQGIKNGITGMMQTIQGDYKPSPRSPTSGASRESSSGNWVTVLAIIFILIVVVLIFRSLLTGHRGATVSSRSGWQDHRGSSREWSSSSSRSSTEKLIIFDMLWRLFLFILQVLLSGSGSRGGSRSSGRRSSESGGSWNSGGFSGSGGGRSGGGGASGSW